MTMNSINNSDPKSGITLSSTLPDASGAEPHQGPGAVEKVAPVDNDKGPTHFTESGEMHVATVYRPSDIPQSLKASAMSLVRQDIESFLARPRKILAGNLATTDLLNSFSLFSAFSYLRSDPWYSKVKGIYGLRATTVLRFLVNGNPYIQGRYILAAIPRGGMEAYTGVSDYHTIAHSYTLTQITQLPHVELDLNRDTSAILKFQYSSASLFYTLGSTSHATSIGDPALYRIFPYSTMVSVAGSNTVGYEIFLSFEDIELGAPVIPQGNFDELRKIGKPVRKPISNVQVKEASASGSGPISGVLSKISRASSILGEVPLFTPVMEPLSWASNIASGVASAFGFSNPTSTGPSADMTIKNMKYLTNSDGLDNSRVLALVSTNEVKQVNASRTEADEMAIDFIKTIPAYFSEFLWRVSDPDETLLWSLPLVIENLNFPVTLGATTFYNYTPVGWLATMFKLWRGSITIKLKIVATRFHTGRIVLSYSPGLVPLGLPTYTQDNSYYLHREIIDLKDGIEFTYTIPYISPYPYAAVSERIGTLNISVINPLNAPDTVANLVKVLIEVHGGSDLEYSAPMTMLAVPLYPVEEQAGDIVFADSQDVASNKYLGGASMIDDGMEGSQTCIGERVTSLRQLFKRATSFTTIPATSTYRIMPFATSYDLISTGGVISGTGQTQKDLYGYISCPFSMVGGSIRLKFFPSTFNAFALEAWLALDGSTTYVGPDLSAGSQHSSPYSYAVTSLESGLEVQIPQYLRTHTRLVQNNLYNSTAVVGNAINTTRLGVPNFSLTLVNAGTSTVRMYRQAADDANLQQFISIPPVYFP
ncbi:hypothetical protein 2 [Forsythia suspensa dicistrovirus]|nr:hypothetical protein 2 [Forsythia suspensa dicistrovirus]QKE44123.1 hypothetical protein 2 [Trichosanthes kirilowii dicistrovirus]